MNTNSRTKVRVTRVKRHTTQKRVSALRHALQHSRKVFRVLNGQCHFERALKKTATVIHFETKKCKLLLDLKRKEKYFPKPKIPIRRKYVCAREYPNRDPLVFHDTSEWLQLSHSPKMKKECLKNTTSSIKLPSTVKSMQKTKTSIIYKNFEIKKTKKIAIFAPKEGVHSQEKDNEFDKMKRKIQVTNDDVADSKSLEDLKTANKDLFDVNTQQNIRLLPDTYNELDILKHRLEIADDGVISKEFVDGLEIKNTWDKNVLDTKKEMQPSPGRYKELKSQELTCNDTELSCIQNKHSKPMSIDPNDHSRKKFEYLLQKCNVRKKQPFRNDTEVVKPPKAIKLLNHSLSHTSNGCRPFKGNPQNSKLIRVTQEYGNTMNNSNSNYILGSLNSSGKMLENDLHKALYQTIKNQMSHEETSKEPKKAHQPSPPQINQSETRHSFNSHHSFNVVDEIDIGKEDTRMSSSSPKMNLRNGDEANKFISKVTILDTLQDIMETNEMNIMDLKGCVQGKEKCKDVFNDRNTTKCLVKSREKKFFLGKRDMERQFSISSIHKEKWIGRKKLVGRKLTFQLMNKNRKDKNKIMVKMGKAIRKRQNKNKRFNQKSLDREKSCGTPITIKGHQFLGKSDEPKYARQNSSDFNGTNSLIIATKLGLISMVQVRLKRISVQEFSAFRSYNFDSYKKEGELNRRKIYSTNPIPKQPCAFYNALDQTRVFVYKLGNGWGKIVVQVKEKSSAGVVNEKWDVLLEPPFLHSKLRSSAELTMFTLKYPKWKWSINLKEVNFDIPMNLRQGQNAKLKQINVGTIERIEDNVAHTYFGTKDTENIIKRNGHIETSIEHLKSKDTLNIFGQKDEEPVISRIKNQDPNMEGLDSISTSMVFEPEDEEGAIRKVRNDKGKGANIKSYVRRYHGHPAILSFPPFRGRHLQNLQDDFGENLKKHHLFAPFTVDKILKLERHFLETPSMPNARQIWEWSTKLGLEKRDVWQWFRWKWNAKIEYEASKIKLMNLDVNESVYTESDNNIRYYSTSRDIKRFEINEIQDAVLPNEDFVIEKDNAEEDFIYDDMDIEIIDIE